MKGLLKQTNPDQPLGGHYKIISELGVGGFGQTFLAEDLHLPDHPLCVVKQLKPQTSEPETLAMARRLFDTEAEVLYQLGNHDQIPRLLAHFEDNEEFYLAQELIDGHPLTEEIKVGQRWSETKVIAFLQDLFQVLAFVHEQNVIHRDLKPSNLIRRTRDNRIVLIDFGAVKQVSAQVVHPQTGHTKTISIGTQGYTPKEQLGGNPRFSSDVYAAGIIAIQALTGLHPRHLKTLIRVRLIGASTLQMSAQNWRSFWTAWCATTFAPASPQQQRRWLHCGIYPHPIPNTGYSLNPSRTTREQNRYHNGNPHPIRRNQQMFVRGKHLLNIGRLQPPPLTLSHRLPMQAQRLTLVKRKILITLQRIQYPPLSPQGEVRKSR